MTRKMVLALAALLTAWPMTTLAQQPEGGAAKTDIEIAGPVLMVADLHRSLRFYVDGLGMEVARELPGNPGPGAVLVAAGKSPPPHLLIRQRSKERTTSPPVDVGNGLSRIMLTAGDTAALAARLRSAGFSPAAPNTGGIFFVNDPDGYRYEIIPRRHAGK